MLMITCSHYVSAFSVLVLRPPNALSIGANTMYPSLDGLFIWLLSYASCTVAFISRMNVEYCPPFSSTAIIFF
jgi:hypothetical protein